MGNGIKLIFLSIFYFTQAIVYEGQDKNPEMCRVLLTHEVMCRYVAIVNFRLHHLKFIILLFV
jgi:hypothetical protein